MPTVGTGAESSYTDGTCVCWPQSIEHLRWDERKLDRVFNFTHLQPGAASWLGQDQVQEIQHNLEVR